MEVITFWDLFFFHYGCVIHSCLIFTMLFTLMDTKFHRYLLTVNNHIWILLVVCLLLLYVYISLFLGKVHYLQTSVHVRIIKIFMYTNISKIALTFRLNACVRWVSVNTWPRTFLIQRNCVIKNENQTNRYKKLTPWKRNITEEVYLWKKSSRNKNQPIEF